MKIRKTLVCASIGLALSLSLVLAQSQPPVTQATTVASNIPPKASDVVKLFKSGVGEDVILAYVQHTKSTFNLSADDILALKNDGISPKVLSAMINRDSSVQNQPESFNYDQKLYGSGGNAPVTPPAQSTPTPSTLPPAVSTVTAPAAPAPTTVVVQQAPPAPQVEYIPVPPGPEYVWTPGYYTWRGGAYVWIGGCYVHRPYHGAVWVGGHWGHRPHGYV
jgi:hypothetical protein